ncbi:MAG: hypothetical protein ABIY37_12700 [Devosia sp.]
MRPLLALALFAALAGSATAASLPMANGYGAIDAPRNTDPVTLAQLFCAARISGDMAPLQEFFAPKLTKLLAETPAAAIPWQSYPDHPQSCAVTVLNGFDDTVGVIVEVAYTAAARTWADQLNLERTPDSWLLNNVFYDGGGNLRFRLVNATP